MVQEISSGKGGWKRYPKYKDSCALWLGEVPEGWEIKPLNFSTDLITDGSHYSPPACSNGFSYITVGDIKKGIIDVENSAKICAEDFQLLERNRCRPKINDILFSKDGTIGKVVLANRDDFVILSSLAIIRPRSFIFPNFLKYFFESNSGIQQMEVHLVGAALRRITLVIINRFKIISPPFPEQIAIAAFLDHETALIDEVISKKERQIELLKEKRAALISHAVTKGLDANVKMKNSGVDWIGVVPEHWEIIKNKGIYQEIDERSITGKEELLTVSHITGVTPRSEKNVNMFLPLSFEGYKLCKNGDLAINTMWAFMGALGFSPCNGIVSPSYNIYRLKKRYVSKYFDYLYRTPAFICEILRYSKGVWTSRLRLYPDEFLSMFSIIPPVDEQKKIVEHINSTIEKEKDQIKKIQHSIDLLKEHRIALISAAVTGKIDVRSEVQA
ncbi:MAG: restriction endonuclease subunit S [Methanoregula sp.]|nr:restriction endonuclease subunit S [Methanoregula sp.]